MTRRVFSLNPSNSAKKYDNVLLQNVISEVALDRIGDVFYVEVHFGGKDFQNFSLSNEIRDLVVTIFDLD